MLPLQASIVTGRLEGAASEEESILGALGKDESSGQQSYDLISLMLCLTDSHWLQPLLEQAGARLCVVSTSLAECKDG